MTGDTKNPALSADAPQSARALCYGVEIIPLASPSQPLLDRIASGLRVSFGCPVSVAVPRELPSAAFEPRRGQYNASTILDALRASSASGCSKLLAVTEVDLFVSGLNFVFGQADLSGSTAVISLARLPNRFYGLPPDDDLFARRAVKEAVHELGHTLGLVHCKLPCVMYFSNSLTDTDRKSAALCAACMGRLAAKENR
jgi:archaemetzincin